jgi:hypothetical protein
MGPNTVEFVGLIRFLYPIGDELRLQVLKTEAAFFVFGPDGKNMSTDEDYNPAERGNTRKAEHERTRYR